MAQAPPLTVPPFQAVSGSYRMRHLYASPGSRKEAPPCLLSRNALHALCMPLASWPTHCQRPGSRARWRCRCSAGGSEPPVLFYSFYTGLSYHEEARIRDFYEPGDDKVVYWKNLHSENPRADSAGKRSTLARLVPTRDIPRLKEDGCPLSGVTLSGALCKPVCKPDVTG